jgi:hypothetical protein
MLRGEIAHDNIPKAPGSLAVAERDPLASLG